MSNGGILAMALLTWTAPVVVRAQEYAPPTVPPVDVDPEGAAAPVGEAKVDDATRRNLYIAATVSFGVGYLTPVVIGAPYGYADQGGWVFVPVAGPILTLAARSGCEAEPDNRPCTGLEPWIPPGLVLASLAQLSGVALLTAALLYDAKPSDPVTVSPSFDTSRLGVEVRGRW